MYALGLGDSPNAVSHECDYPNEALAKPRIVRSGLKEDNIDSLVKTRFEEVPAI